jgi:FkbM family methyltransferase
MLKQIDSSLINRIKKYVLFFSQGCRYRGFIPQLHFSIASKINNIKFNSLNNGLTSEQIAVCQGVVLNTHPDAYHAFRYFTDFDPDMVDEMQSFIRLIQEKNCLLDVGAHYGIFSLVFTKRADTVAFAIEPSPSTYKILRYHQAANQDCNLKPFQFALGASEGKLQMQEDGSHFVATSTVNTVAEKITDIDITTIDIFIRQQEIVPDVIKIDVEGFELNVLKGAVTTLSQNNPLIFLEVHPALLEQNGDSVEELVNFMSHLNYNFYDDKYKLIRNTVIFLSKGIRRVICSK